MKIKTNRIKTPRTSRGSVLLVSLGFAVIISVTLGSYLALIAGQHLTVARSQAWNTAIAVAEAGVEEALTQLHSVGTNNLGANGWTLGADGMFHKSRSLSPAKSYYSVA